MVESEPRAEPVAEYKAEVPKVLVVSPCYGGCTINYAQSFYGAIRDRSIVIPMGGRQPNNSLLPTSFNECLSHALNERDAGNVTHLAMLHTDIAAGVGWVDELWSAMWLEGAMFVGTNVAIKGGSGRTSTGIGDMGDRWKVWRSLYLHDIEKLPRTFGPEHVCGPDEVLLPNTGCWLSDIRHPFWNWFATERSPGGISGFNLHSRLVRAKTLDGGEAWTVETRSEDYELGRDMVQFQADTGIRTRYVITRRVKLWHEGGGRWPNFVESAGSMSTAG